MADEHKQPPRRSTRAPKPDAGEAKASGSRSDSGRHAPAESPRKGVNARNDNAGKKSQAAQGKEPAKPAKPDKPDGGVDKEANANQDKDTAAEPKGADKDAQGPAAGKLDAAKKQASSELKGSNATGVDYSDKSLKDQLEHQAADVAMDATPVLGQINSARKALKQANKQKKEATGNPDSNDALDKTEEVADKAVDGGIKGAKMLAGAWLGSNMGVGAAAMLMLMKTVMMLKTLALGIAGKIAGFFAGMFQAVSSFFTSFLGTTAAVGNALASVMMGLSLVIGGVGGVGLVNTVTLKDPGAGACLPDAKAVTVDSQDYVEAGGEAALLQAENAGKLWSVYSAMGASKEQTAAVLGNLHYESAGLDPTATETISSEPFVMGPLKLDALAKDYNVDAINPDYGARFPAIERIGIGLAQWTNGRNQLLIDYASGIGANWYEFDTQIKFMLAGDDAHRQTQLQDFLAATPGTIDAETERFMNTWIGLSSPNPSSGARQEHAVGYLFTLERATADTAYAEGILSNLNVNRGNGNAAAGAYFHDDGCGDAIATNYAGDKAEDGTGEVPAGLALVPWTRETLPASLASFAVDPELAGLAWGQSSGWATGIYPGQCVALASSYFMQLYPEWNQNGRGTARPTGNGKFTAGGWATHYGALTTTAPSTGAVFSNSTSSAYGHTGIVQHVFANGDILIAEQNIRGASGDANGQQYSWSWRVIKTDRYQQDNWVFFKPNDAEPQWTKPSA